MLEGAATGGSFHTAKAPPSPFVTALFSTALGEHKQALAALQQSCNEHEPGLIYLKVDPTWDSLRAEPAFQAVERRMGLQ